jgi:competence protein ComEA
MRVMLAASSAPERSPDELGAPATPAAVPLLVVDVEGAVSHPGLYRLHGGSRVADAIVAAGGASGDADLAAVDRAEVLEDGAEVVVPLRGAAVEGVAAKRKHHARRRHRRRRTESPAPEPSLLNLNTASEAQLAALPGLGTPLARRIVLMRSAAGGFDSFDELRDVRGISEGLVQRLALRLAL